MTTLAELEAATAERLGPFALLETLSADQASLTVEVLKSTIDLGGFEDLFLLRREATAAADRVARVKHYDPALGQLQPDRRYVVSPIPSEPVELHHLDPAVLRRGVRAGLRRTFCQYWLTLNGVNGSEPGAPVAPETGPVDLTDYSEGWLTLPQQVLDVLDPGDPALGDDRASVAGWDAYQHNGRSYLVLPAGTSNLGCSVIANRAWFTLVNGQTVLDGPTDDADVLDVDVAYAAALGAIELWRIARDRLEAVAAEARMPTQAEHAAEATRLAVANAPWLFAPGTTRKDRVAPLRGLRGAGGPTTAPSLQGAWVNGPAGTEPLGLPLGNSSR
jgi:hypothetical protein